MSLPLKPHSRATGLCTWCPKLCRFCCPVAAVEYRETVTPWFKMSLAERVRAGQTDPCGEAGEIFLHCLGCLHCRTHCKHENDVPATLFAARTAGLMSCGEAPAVAGVLDRFRDTGNPWGEDLQAMLPEHVPETYFVPEAQAVVFAGCQAIRDGQRHLGPLFTLFETLGVDHVGIHHADPLCCGAPLWQAGDVQAFAEHARELAAQLGRVRQVICPCPTCAHVLVAELAAAGVQLGPEVVTLDRFLLPLVQSRPPKKLLQPSVVFHDPCYLTRYLERGKAVRSLLAEVFDGPLPESHWSGEDASCCGGGGLVPHTLPQVAADAAELRMGQLQASGAQRVVTACPGCVRQLSGADGLPVLDLAELLLEAYR